MFCSGYLVNFWVLFEILGTYYKFGCWDVGGTILATGLAGWASKFQELPFSTQIAISSRMFGGSLVCPQRMRTTYYSNACSVNKMEVRWWQVKYFSLRQEGKTFAKSTMAEIFVSISLASIIICCITLWSGTGWLTHFMLCAQP